MPGISVLKGNFISKNLSASDEVYDDETIISCALNSVLHDDRYTKEIILKGESFLVACTRYPEYPITIYENEHFWVCIEGKIYGQDKSRIKEEIATLLLEISVPYKNKEIGNNAIDRWLSVTDGEFIIYALNKRNNEFVIINDVLGHLPLYYYSDHKRLIISRELPLITYLLWHNDNDSNTKNECLFDKMAIAQYLLFGYTLDKRTLIKDVCRMQSGALVRIRNSNYNNDDGINKEMLLKIENLFSFDFEHREHANESLKENTDMLVSLFSDACKNRADLNGNNIISLSGGFDSRIVAACFYKINIPCRGVTYLEQGWRPLLGNKTESEIAKKISNNFGLDWKDYGTIRAIAKDFLTLLRFKVGSTNLGYSFMLQLLATLKKESTCNATFLTGYGGGPVLVNQLPPKKYMNMNELVSGIIARASFLSLSDVSKLVQINEGEIFDELKRVISLHPEKDLAQKYVHFIIYGNFFKMFEVVDTERLYFWSTSPFYSIPFFKYVMNCSDNNKLSMALHREILGALSPSATAIDSSNYGCPIISYKFRVIIPILRSIIFRYPILRRIAALTVRNKNHGGLDNKMIMCLKDQMKNCEHLSRYFSTRKLSNMARNPAKYGLHAVHHLFTIISLIEKTYSGTSTIEKYYD